MNENKKTVAMCTSRIFDIQNHAFIKKLNESLQESGIRLLVYALNTDLYWEEEADTTEAYIFDVIPMWKIDILLFMDEKVKSNKVARHVIEKAKSFNVPVLVADGSYEGCASVSFDFEKGLQNTVTVNKHNGEPVIERQGKYPGLRYVFTEQDVQAAIESVPVP